MRPGGGGVGIYVKNHLSYKTLKQYSIFVERIFESLFIEVSLSGNKKVIIGLFNVLAELSNNYENVFIYGDFNLNVLEITQNKYILEYIDTIFSHGFLQLVTKPTRIAAHSATLIDHILTNSAIQDHNTFLLCSKMSDHFPIIHQLSFSKEKLSSVKIESRDFSDESLLRFKNAIKNYNWTHFSNSTDVHEASSNFFATFDTLYNTFFPRTIKKFIKSLNPLEPWMSRGLLTSM